MLELPPHGRAGHCIAILLVRVGVTLALSSGVIIPSPAQTPPRDLTQFSLEDLDLILDVNIRGVFLAIQAAAGQMRDGGRIITIGSNTAIRTGTPGGSVYAMTKAAVASLVRGVALDLAPRRITVNNVQPGPTETDMTATMVSRLKEIVPLKRVGEPGEIAALVSYVAGPESGYMTGASLTIDGGYVL